MRYRYLINLAHHWTYTGSSQFPSGRVGHLDVDGMLAWPTDAMDVGSFKYRMELDMAPTRFFIPE